MATAEEYARWIVANADKRGTPEFDTVAQAYKIAKGGLDLQGMQRSALDREQTQQNNNRSETTFSGVFSEAGKGLFRGAQDVSKAMIGGAGRYILSPLMGPHVDYGVNKLYDLSRELLKPTPNTPVERMVGTGSEFIGANAVSGGLNTIPKAIYSGISALGAAAGEQARGEKGKFIGSLAPLPLSTGVGLARAAKNYVYPSVGKIGTQAAGDKADAVIKALRETKSDVPGVNLHSGQASVPANSAEFAALQSKVAKADPSRYSGPLGVEGEQAAARVNAVKDKIGGTPEQLAKAIASRKSASDMNYESAFEEIVKRDKELRELWKNPYFKEHTGEAYKLLRAEANIRGEKMPITKNLTRFLQYVKEGMDAHIETLNNPQLPAISRSSKRAVLDAKDKLLEWLDQRNPAYEFARSEHAAASAPINQMKTGQQIERALVAPATEAERVGSFGSAVRGAEQKVSKATGRPRIEDLTPKQRATLDAIEADFKRNAIYKDLASAGRTSMENRIGAPELPPTGFFQPMVSAARGWANRILGSGVEKGIERSSVPMSNPKEMARLMREYQSGHGYGYKEAMRRAAIATAIQQGGQ